MGHERAINAIRGVEREKRMEIYLVVIRACASPARRRNNVIWLQREESREMAFLCQLGLENLKKCVHLSVRSQLKVRNVGAAFEARIIATIA